MARVEHQPVARTVGLTKRYKDAEVVSGVSLEVAPGQVYGFLGPNGAGKSTTMKMLLGLTRPSAGSVEVFGEPFSPSRTLARVGSLIEQPSFYGHLTGRENLDIVRRVKHLPASTVGDALDTVGLAHAGDKQARAYSLGMKQRLGLAMALLGDPELLVLDEPTNGLDPSGIHEIRELITSLPRTRGISVVVSSHLLSEIEQMADTIGIISHGHLVYQGPLSALAEAGRLVVRVDADQAAPTARQLAARGWRVSSVEDGEITMPAYSDDHVARLVATLVGAGTSIYRVELRRRSLEQIFLDITEQAPPQGRPGQPGAPAQAQPPQVPPAPPAAGRTTTGTGTQPQHSRRARPPPGGTRPAAGRAAGAPAAGGTPPSPAAARPPDAARHPAGPRPLRRPGAPPPRPVGLAGPGLPGDAPPDPGPGTHPAGDRAPLHPPGTRLPGAAAGPAVRLPGAAGGGSMSALGLEISKLRRSRLWLTLALTTGFELAWALAVLTTTLADPPDGTPAGTSLAVMDASGVHAIIAPITSAVVASRLAAAEHDSTMLSQLLAVGQSRTSLFLAKLTTALAACSLPVIALVAATTLATTASGAPVDAGLTATWLGGLLLANTAVTTIHLALALLVHRQALTLTTGALGGLLCSLTDIVTPRSLAVVLPWQYPALLVPVRAQREVTGMTSGVTPLEHLGTYTVLVVALSLAVVVLAQAVFTRQVTR